MVFMNLESPGTNRLRLPLVGLSFTLVRTGTLLVRFREAPLPSPQTPLTQFAFLVYKIFYQVLPPS